ncbi:MAG: hypothetical protein KQH59_06465 [Desulfobulbaceae bacterium]|nr:hypothetical protein [Desulfobulbaceae bacterium]
MNENHWSKKSADDEEIVESMSQDTDNNSTEQENVEEFNLPAGMKSVPAHWKKMKRYRFGQSDDTCICRTAMESLGIPYSELRLHEQVAGFYEIAETSEVKRVHLHPMPKRLLTVLCSSTPSREKHWYLYLLHQFAEIKIDHDFPKYNGAARAAMCVTDAEGRLREMPENLEKALKYDQAHFDQVFVQKAIYAFYAPERLRKILYHTAPPDQRCYYLLDEKERKSCLTIDYPETEFMLRFRLLERLDEKGQIRELCCELERAIIEGEVLDGQALDDFDRAKGY